MIFWNTGPQNVKRMVFLMTEPQQKRTVYPAVGWFLAAAALLLLLLPGMINDPDGTATIACFLSGAVLAAALAVLNIRFRKNKKWGLWIVNVLLLLLAAVPMVLWGSMWALDHGGTDAQRAVSQVGLSDSSASLMARYDSHGGFHGDGVSMEVYALEGAAPSAQMKSLPGWRTGPLDENVLLLAYGSEERSPCLTDLDHRPLVPDKDWVCWYFEDRLAQEDTDGRYATHGVLNRPSLNFTLALCDGSGQLYIFKLDT